MIFTPEELAQMAKADAEIEADFQLGADDFAMSRELDRAARIDAMTRDQQRVAARQKAWYEANREKVAAQKKAYREANRERIAAYQRAYRAKRRAREVTA